MSKNSEALNWQLVLMFVGELAWIVLTPWIGWNLGGGWWLGAVVAVVMLAGLVVMWARWMAPRSPSRLEFEDRQLVIILYGSGLTMLAALAGLMIPTLIASLLVLWAHRGSLPPTAD